AGPLHRFIERGKGAKFVPVDEPSTLATAIKIGNPVSWKKAVRALDWSGGAGEVVAQLEIADAKAGIGRDGIGCEPASAAPLAGIKRLAAGGANTSEGSVAALLHREMPNA